MAIMFHCFEGKKQKHSSSSPTDGTTNQMQDVLSEEEEQHWNEDTVIDSLTPSVNTFDMSEDVSEASTREKMLVRAIHYSTIPVHLFKWF